jgi:hypothetical protein
MLLNQSIKRFPSFFQIPCPRLYPCPVSVSMSMSIIGVHMFVLVSALLYVLMYMHVHVHIVRLRERVRVHVRVNLQKHIPHTGNRGWICVGNRTGFIVRTLELFYAFAGLLRTTFSLAFCNVQYSVPQTSSA